MDGDYLHQMVLNFSAGQLKDHVGSWESLTSDQVILDAIKHYHIEFEANTPVQPYPPKQIHFSPSEREIITEEISKLLSKGVLEKTEHAEGDFLSTIFVRPKKDGSYRMILNLKPLNEFVSYYHFKMDTIHTALKLMRPGCFMASVDLKDAYYSVPVAKEHRKYLKFEWQGSYYEYTCLPNGLACAPRLFTKILKPVYSHIRSMGHICMGHIDDSFLLGHDHIACQRNVQDTVDTFHNLGLNFKIPTYVSWKPDPHAKHVNALFMQWEEHYFYAFPPFSLIATCLRKVEQDQAIGVILVPFWQTQPWFTMLLHLLIDNPVFLPRLDYLLTQPHNNTLHPLRKQLKLMACKISGKASSSATYQRRLQQSSCSHGQMGRRNNINCTSSSGLTFVVNDRLIPTIHL